MPRRFSDDAWQRIFDTLEGREEEFGLPEQRDGSVLLASFNIRRLGAKRRSVGAWKMLQRFAQRCDLLAIQEVQDDLSGLRRLRWLLNGGPAEHVNDILPHPSAGAEDDNVFRLAASDVTGSFPGKSPPPERLAFLYRQDTVRRTEIASDITYDRSSVTEVLYELRGDFHQSFERHAAKLARFDAGLRKTKPSLKLPHFVSFIRQPHCVSFHIIGPPGVPPYELMAVNAHLLYGTKAERELEFQALLAWLVERARQVDRLYHQNFLLMGDLNLNFKAVDSRRDFIISMIKGLNRGSLDGTGTRINFPFLDVHPDHDEVFRTNARLDQTFDHIALLCHDRRLPRPSLNDQAGQLGDDDFDYGVFDFVELFRQALDVPPLATLSKDDRKAFFAQFEHDFSDHMPIWVRLPKPSRGQSPPPINTETDP